MTDKPGYTRSTFHLRNDTGRPLTDADVVELLGTEMTATLHDVSLSSGTVTNVRVVDDGSRIQVTVESGGRACAACGTVFDVDQAGGQMLALAEIRSATPELVAGLPMYEGLPGWVWVCFSPALCLRRRDDKSEG